MYHLTTVQSDVHIHYGIHWGTKSLPRRAAQASLVNKLTREINRMSMVYTDNAIARRHCGRACANWCMWVWAQFPAKFRWRARFRCLGSVWSHCLCAWYLDVRGTDTHKLLPSGTLISNSAPHSPPSQCNARAVECAHSTDWRDERSKSINQWIKCLHLLIYMDVGEDSIVRNFI